MTNKVGSVAKNIHLATKILLKIKFVASEFLKRGLMNPTNSFKWRHYSSEIILLCVRWYCRYCLSYRNLEEMMNERGLTVDHTTIYRWVQRYAVEIRRRLAKFVRSPNTSWRVDETYIKIKGVCHYLYRAIDSNGETLDFYLSKKRDANAAFTFFQQLSSIGDPRVINVDKDKAYPCAFAEMQEKGIFENTELRRVKYLNNIIEQDHRMIKKQYHHSLGYKEFSSASNTIEGIEAMHMIFKGQIDRIPDGNAYDVKLFIEELFKTQGLAA